MACDFQDGPSSSGRGGSQGVGSGRACGGRGGRACVLHSLVAACGLSGLARGGGVRGVAANLFALGNKARCAMRCKHQAERVCNNADIVERGLARALDWPRFIHICSYDDHAEARGQVFHVHDARTHVRTHACGHLRKFRMARK